MTRNEEAIRRLARRAGVSVDELLEAARRPEFNETMAAAIETTTDVWLDAAEKADRGVQQADDPAVA
jgi:hypothetical protein